ncbi:MAG: hypothetical protein Q4C39_05865 [Clostridia bacterium]|nr:hypothetical protein [Clostridia bacterium]
MSNSSIDNKLNEINDRNRQNPQNEPDEEENMSGFEKGRLAALNAKYEDDDEPKNQNGNDGGSEEEESPEDENDEDKDDDDDDEENDNDDKNNENDNENNNKPDENENKSNDKNSDDKENSDKPDSKENKKEKDSKNQNNKEPQSPTDNKKPAEKPQTPKAGQEGAKEGTKQAGKEGAKQAGKEGAKAAAKAGTKVAAKAGIAASPPVLIVILVIVAIIFLIGIISFFSIMGDMIIGKLKNFLQGVWDAIQTVTTGDQAYANINDEHVKNAASYLEQMGYDLIGMGFVKTEYNTTNKNEGEAWNKWYNENGELIEEGTSNKKDLIEREEDTTEDESEGEKSGAEQKDPIKKIKSEPIRKYLVTALRSYINGTYGGMVVQEGHEADGLWNTVFDKIAFNSKEHTLTVTKGDTHVKVNLESWTAKYGMSFEFLVCLHLGTLAPEFVMDLAGDADNRVKVVVNFFKQERNKKI